MNKTLLCFLAFAASFTGCRKYLNKISDSSLIVPDNVPDMWKLIDNIENTINSTPGLGQLGTTDYWYPDAMWPALSPLVQNASTWQTNIDQGDKPPSWFSPYQAIFNANAILINIPNVNIGGPSDVEQLQYIKGSALFLRAFHLYHLEETYGQPFDPATASSDLGVIIRTTENMYDKTGRSYVLQVFKQITSDLGHAVPLLPQPLQYLHRNRPCKAAALALLSTVYLSMQQYDSALVYADSSLRYNNQLIDYNDINPSVPFAYTGNEEVLFQASAVSIPGQSTPYVFVDSDLYRSYAADDLRKTVFFRPASSGIGYYMRPGYSGAFTLFSGVAADETWLTRAECLARLGQIQEAIETLNGFLLYRYRTGTFQPYAAGTAGEALRVILEHRRKEILFREGRWADLRRLNQDPRFADTLARVVNGRSYILPPGDNRYTYPIPEQEILLGGIQQNPR
ncbi:MAG TPA: RagB/SusD family nutrient uptake outer membrane protein [Puia sp.]|nr:RagB/SusD family nutrient uptake outer membrane protein [Puia sp.]